MGVIYEEMEYIRVYEAGGNGEAGGKSEQVPRRYSYNACFRENSQYVVRRGLDYVLLFPLSSFLLVSFQFVLDSSEQNPRPNVSMVQMSGRRGTFLDRINDGIDSRSEQSMITYEDYAVFGGEKFNAVNFCFDFENDDGPDNFHDVCGYPYELRVEADVGLDHHISKLLRFYVRSE